MILLSATKVWLEVQRDGGIRSFPIWRLCSSGSSRLSPSGFWGAPPSEHLSIRVRSFRDQLHGPIRFPQHSFSVHDHGRQRSGGDRNTLSTLTLSSLYIEPSPCGGVRPAGDPVDCDPGAVFEDDPHPRSDAGRPLEPWVCRHTPGADGLVQAELPPTSAECWPFSPALPVTLARPLLPPIHGWLLGMDRWGLSSPYRVATTYPFWAARFSLLLDSLEVLPRRLDGTTAGSFSPACATQSGLGVCTHAGSEPLRVRRRLLETCLGDSILLAISPRNTYIRQELFRRVEYIVWNLSKDQTSLESHQCSNNHQCASLA